MSILDRIFNRNSENTLQLSTFAAIEQMVDISESKALSTQLRDWKISVSFGKSSSQNYAKAMFLAKAAPTYHEQTDDSHVLHQAIYSAAPNDFLAFISLYELVSSWRSSFVIVNGSIIDRKIIGQLNYCYGDKCRSGNKAFCFGASELTKNPFGCHRLQVSAANSPWWTFSMPQEGGYHIIDKNAIKDKIDGYAKVYCICPNFDYQYIIDALNKLPARITDKEYQQLHESVYLVAHNRIEMKY